MIIIDWQAVGIALGAIGTGWSAYQQYLISDCKAKEIRLQAVEQELAQLQVQAK